jgi:hypothetical protein
MSGVIRHPHLLHPRMDAIKGQTMSAIDRRKIAIGSGGVDCPDYPGSSVLIHFDVLKSKRGSLGSSAVCSSRLSLDKASQNLTAIRGREQQLIDFSGGAQSIGGTSGNAINGISDYNPLRSLYMSAATDEFGSLPDNSPKR